MTDFDRLADGSGSAHLFDSKEEVVVASLDLVQ